MIDNLETDNGHHRDKVYPVYSRSRGPGALTFAITTLVIVWLILTIMG